MALPEDLQSVASSAITPRSEQRPHRRRRLQRHSKDILLSQDLVSHILKKVCAALNVQH